MPDTNHISKKYKLLLCSNETQSEESEEILIEYKLSVYVNDIRYVNLICTHKNLYELVLGNLFSEGIIHGMDEIKSLEILEDEGKAFVKLKTSDVFKDVINATEGIRTVTTACGKQHSIAYYLMNDWDLTALDYSFTIKFSKILSYMNEFQKSSDIYKLTRGIHSCGLYDNQGLLYLMEDIGRHNAVDKILGYSMDQRIDLSKTVLITSGRVPSDMITKIIKAKIPILVARSVPTDVAIEMANKFNITLVGSAKGTRLNLYSNEQRLLFD
ncbi:MAG: formate dehydrogenase accessory sulfurtransferase FdhD [Hungatella sp.]|jgi:FdhD protein|nr:formate dehydrogenase accessory sulfurtransferase FdhD [Hungatella sp.]